MISASSLAGIFARACGNAGIAKLAWRDGESYELDCD
jgi:hypothetical protein